MIIKLERLKLYWSKIMLVVTFFKEITLDFKQHFDHATKCIDTPVKVL